MTQRSAEGWVIVVLALLAVAVGRAFVVALAPPDRTDRSCQAQWDTADHPGVPLPYPAPR